MKIFIIGFSLLITSLSAFSADLCTSWGCKSTISDLYTNIDGLIYIGTPVDEKLANCTPLSGIYFTLNTSSGNAKEVYSSLLAAYMSNSIITLRIKEGSPSCELSYVRLSK